MRELIEIACQVIRETEKAYQVNDGTRDVWLPKSQVEKHDDTDPRKRTCVMVMPEWLAKEKGLI